MAPCVFRACRGRRILAGVPWSTHSCRLPGSAPGPRLSWHPATLLPSSASCTVVDFHFSTVHTLLIVHTSGPRPGRFGAAAEKLHGAG
eukprot:366427-Chlamydomonas_euryale.AAC.5